MDELQLALTAARVDQKNFGLWLKSWQVGQVLQALVTDKTPSGDLILRIAGHQVTATADIPVQKGAQLSLEISRLDPVPTLKIINTPVPLTTHSNSAMAGQLQLLVPRQGDVVEPFRMLFNTAQGVNILSLLGFRPAEQTQIQRLVVDARQLTDPKLLKQTLNQSGLFLEAHLKQLLLMGGVLPRGDLKAELLRMLSRVKFQQDTAGSSSGSMDSEGLLELQHKLEGALARMTLAQMQAGEARETGSYRWAFELPVKINDDYQTLSISIGSDESRLSEDEQPRGWSVLLGMEFPKLGHVEAELFFSGKKLSVVTYAASPDTFKLMEDQVELLRSSLESRGLETGAILCRRGSNAETSDSAIHSSCVDERI